MKHELTHITKTGISVEYGRVPNILAPNMHGIIYYISTSTDNAVDHAERLKEVVDMLESDSYDHCSEWRRDEHRIIQGTKWKTISLVSFRVRDSY